MKISYIILTAIMASAFACTKQAEWDPTATNGHRHNGDSITHWMDAALCEWYLWNTETKAINNPDYELPDDEFFVSMLSRNDGYDQGSYHYFYSYFNKYLPGQVRANVSSDSGLGFHYFIESEVESLTGDQYIYAVVAYVVKDSPAERANLKRGHIIGSVNGQRLYRENYEAYLPYLNGVRGRVELGVYTYRYDENGNFSVTDAGDRTIVPEPIADDPVHMHKVINSGGRKVGYLVYNEFEYGENHIYDNSLKAAFRHFEAQGIDDLVLDMRYNNGGYVTSSLLLSSMLAPADKLGTLMMKITYNSDKVKEDPAEYDYWVSFLTRERMEDQTLYGDGTGANVDLQRLFVLTTQATASSSELVINNAEGAGMQVYKIGETTRGKNVGSLQLRPATAEGTWRMYDGYYYEMWPIAFSVINARGYGSFKSGFEPDYEMDEWRAGMVELGETDEPLLAAALGFIATGEWPAQEPEARSAISVGRHYSFEGGQRGGMKLQSEAASALPHID